MAQPKLRALVDAARCARTDPLPPLSRLTHPPPQAYCTRNFYSIYCQNTRCDFVRRYTGTADRAVLDQPWSQTAKYARQLGGWMAPRGASTGSYLQLTYSSERTFTGVVTQGADVPTGKWYVQRYRLQYSLDCSSFTNYVEGGVAVQFGGNYDNWNKRTNTLRYPIVARCIRIVPVMGSPDASQTGYGLRAAMMGFADESPCHESTNLARHPVLRGPEFQSCPSGGVFVFQAGGGSALRPEWAVPVAEDVSGAVYSGSITGNLPRPSTTAWPAVGGVVASHTSGSSTFAPNSDKTVTYGVSDARCSGSERTDVCSFRVVSRTGSWTSDLAGCPADVDTTVDQGSRAAAVSFSLPSGASSTAASGAAFRPGTHTVTVFNDNSRKYCTFNVAVKDAAARNGGAGTLVLQQGGSSAERDLVIDAGGRGSLSRYTAAFATYATWASATYTKPNAEYRNVRVLNGGNLATLGGGTLTVTGTLSSTGTATVVVGGGSQLTLAGGASVYTKLLIADDGDLDVRSGTVTFRGTVVVAGRLRTTLSTDIVVGGGLTPILSGQNYVSTQLRMLSQASGETVPPPPTPPPSPSPPSALAHRWSAHRLAPATTASAPSRSAPTPWRCGRTRVWCSWRGRRSATAPTPARSPSRAAAP